MGVPPCADANRGGGNRGKGSDRMNTTDTPQAYLMDMDGVLVRGTQLIAGADAFIERLRAHSIPFLILTLGLFYFVLNGILLWVAQFFLPGYHVQGIVAGILGSLVFTFVNWLIHAVFGGRK